MGPRETPFDLDSLAALLLRLARYGTARNREVEREPREITISDDDALLILNALRAFDHPLMNHYGLGD